MIKVLVLIGNCDLFLHCPEKNQGSVQHYNQKMSRKKSWRGPKKKMALRKKNYPGILCKLKMKLVITRKHHQGSKQTMKDSCPFWK